ncbi:unnamed protein product [Parascedosporium putredinis]|uniref:Uncharacterized protein n=1 Tax=Parascedosporium putredinis TaxID=1442378 RepID=A0A9P1H7U0_9PEZI|nr:unnamed protein product [Parascedosporium putredinis]CAI7998988.1 unnamed protein product [Parascedosporium putredinis]
MALDLGLGRACPVRRKPTGAASNAINFFTFRPGKEDPESLECRRTWLMCYYLASNAAMGLRRPYLVRWSVFIEESLKLLETSAEAAPTDKQFCILLRINKLGEDVSTRFSVDDPAMAATLQDFGTQLALRGFEVELERLKRSIPESLMQPVIILGIEYLNIYMHESCLQNANTDTFKSCLTTATIDTMLNPKAMGKAQIDALLACVAAITTSFDTFLGMDIARVRCLPVFNFVRIAYSLVILIKVNLAMSAAETPLTTIIADNLRAETYLDSLLAKLSEASSEGRCRPAGKFLSVLSTLKGWFTNKGAQQRKNGRPERHSGNEAGPGLRPFSSPTPTVGTTTAESGVRSGPTTRQTAVGGGDGRLWR